MGDSFFSKIKDSSGSIGDLEESILGPEYKYYKYIKTPEDMGMSSEGSLEVLGKNIKGLMSYTQLLVTGGGNANGSTSGHPLGNKFFMDTGATCVDVETSNNVPRSIYIDNVPGGTIPFLTSGTGVQFSEFEGLVPGTLENITRINPLKIFKTFTTGANPKCRALRMEVISKDNETSFETKYITEDDILDIPPCSFIEKKNPVTKVPCREAFTTSGMSGSFGASNSRMNARQGNYNMFSYSTPCSSSKCCNDVKECTKPKTKLYEFDNEYEYEKREGFVVNENHDFRQKNPIKSSKSDFPEDLLVKIYFSTLGLFGLYLLTKLIVKQGALNI